MTLTELATADVVTADSDTDIHEILEHLDDRHVGSCVITDGDEPIGIITDRMIAMSMRDHDSLDGMSADDVMTEDLVTIGGDESHSRAVQMMSDEGIRRLPVVDDDGSLTGIITLDDIIMVMAAELSNASDVIERQAGTR